MTEPPAATILAPSVPKLSFLALKDRPDSIRRARHFVGAAVDRLPYAVDEIELITAELLTNAINAVRRLGPLPYDLWPVSVEIAATARLVHLVVTDIDTHQVDAEPATGPLAESGRGLGIVDCFAAERWTEHREHGKAVHVVIPAAGVELSGVELAALGWRPCST